MEGALPNTILLIILTQPVLILRNPLGCAVAITALDVLVDERLCERAYILGEYFRSAVRALNSPLVLEVRGRGLLNAVVVNEKKSKKGRTAWQLCLLLKSRGVLAKPTHVNMWVFLFSLEKYSPNVCFGYCLYFFAFSVRFAPPLVILEEDLAEAVKIIGECLVDIDQLEYIPGDVGSEKGHKDILAV